jgi:hypothetical protein
MTFASSAAVPTPSFAPRGGFFTSNVLVTIAGSSNQIRYTLDGTEPGTNAPLYTAPLLITNSARLRACVFESGTNAGVIMTEAYSVLDTNVAGFSSTLPLIVLNSFGQAMPPASNAVVWMHVFNLATNQRAVVQSATAEFAGPISIKARGFTSLRNPKKSYSVETLDAAGENAPVSLLGMPADHDWILYAPYSDKTMIRDVLAYELSNKLAHYASRTRFVEVFINDSTNPLSRSHYAGVYVLEEKIKISTNRVALSKLKPKIEAEPDISGGYLFKKDHLEKVLGEVPNDGPAHFQQSSLRGHECSDGDEPGSGHECVGAGSFRRGRENQLPCCHQFGQRDQPGSGDESCCCDKHLDRHQSCRRHQFGARHQRCCGQPVRERDESGRHHQSR